MRIVLLTENVKGEKDFAITPYLYLVWIKNGNTRMHGLGLGWGNYSVAIALGISLPDNFPSYKHFSN